MKYDIDQIRDYLQGGLFIRGSEAPATNHHNNALLALLHDLEDPQDGIKAMTERKQIRRKIIHKMFTITTRK